MGRVIPVGAQDSFVFGLSRDDRFLGLERLGLPYGRHAAEIFEALPLRQGLCGGYVLCKFRVIVVVWRVTLENRVVEANFCPSSVSGPNPGSNTCSLWPGQMSLGLLAEVKVMVYGAWGQVEGN